MSTARREGFTTVKQLGGALAQPLPLRVGEFVHQWTMFLHDQRARRFLFNDFLRGFHALFILFSRPKVKLTRSHTHFLVITTAPLHDSPGGFSMNAKPRFTYVSPRESSGWWRADWLHTLALCCPTV